MLVIDKSVGCETGGNGGLGFEKKRPGYCENEKVAVTLHRFWKTGGNNRAH